MEQCSASQDLTTEEPEAKRKNIYKEEPEKQVITKIERVTGNDLGSKLRKKLNASHFRYLSEFLYTVPSAEAFETLDDESFSIYHDGYQTQLSKWPVKPLAKIKKWLMGKYVTVYALFIYLNIFPIVEHP